MSRFTRTLKASFIGLATLGAALFIPAGTFAYWQGWTFILVFTACTTIIGVYLAIKDPVLLDRRINAGPAAETRPLQKIVISLAFLGFYALAAVSALDCRFGWSRVPVWFSVVGDALVALGLMIDLRAFRENSFGASTIALMEGQKVISTGPYALVRHPMYVGVLVFVLGVPLALGSLWGLLFLFVNLPILMFRLLDEEQMLRRDLDGYDAYTRKVRFRLVPGVW